MLHLPWWKAVEGEAGNRNFNATFFGRDIIVLRSVGRGEGPETPKNRKCPWGINFERPVS